MKRLAWLAAGMTCAVMILVGCDPGTFSHHAGRVDPALVSPSTADTPAIGMLVGASPVDHALRQAGPWAADARLVAAVAGTSGAHVIIDRFGSGPGSSDVMYDARVTSTAAQNGLIRKTRVQAAEKSLEKAFGEEQATVTDGSTDVISGIRAMAQHLSVFRHTKTISVVIWGNAVQTAAPINLANPVQLADPQATLRVVISRGLLPNCSGWRVYMIDGSLSPAGGPSALQDEQLREFWREFFTRCGGQLVLWDTSLIAFPASGQVQPTSWAKAGNRQIIIPLPASVLFEPNSPVFLPGARQILTVLTRELTVIYPAATAEIAGYTAAVGRGPESIALHLSRERAQAVAASLEAGGVRPSRLSVHGYGDQDQIASDATAAGQALNRRVVVTLHVG
jgi:outer membrane protein OmpA-like peptidoglycan-associated protein